MTHLQQSTPAWNFKTDNFQKASKKHTAGGNIKWYNHFRKQFGSFFKSQTWASLVAQWLRICLPIQGTRVRALIWEDPTCRGATKPVSHNYWACASGACAPQWERPRQWEARAPWWRVAPAHHSWRKPLHRNEDQTQPKIKKIFFKSQTYTECIIQSFHFYVFTQEK